MNVALFLKNVPEAVKNLIGKEAFENRRSINQEAIALLEEALLHRVETHHAKARSLLERLRPGSESPADKGSATRPPEASPMGTGGAQAAGSEAH